MIPLELLNIVRILWAKRLGKPSMNFSFQNDLLLSSLNITLEVKTVGYISCDSVKGNNNYNNKSVTLNK